jgi:hypothetical protein
VLLYLKRGNAEILYFEWGIFMHTIKAIYDGTNFKAIQPIPVKGEYEVFITFIEPLKKDASKTKREAMFGYLRGKYKIADDFDAPIDDFKEYME